MVLDKLTTLVKNQKLVVLFIAGISLFSLVMALFAEAVLKLEPCMLCIYQRIPFLVALVVSLVALGIKRPLWALVVSAAAFLINSGIAFYHSGVERHWWTSVIEGCAVPDFSGNPQSMLENILSAPTGNCAEIPWADPVFGLSMANYNVALCFGLFVLCVLSVAVCRKKDNG